MNISVCDKVSGPGQNFRMAKTRVKDVRRERHRKRMGDLIRAARIASGNEPIDVAKELGVRVNTYLSWERGHAYIPMYLIGPLCRKIRTTPGFILTGKANGTWEEDGTETGMFSALRPPRD